MVQSDAQKYDALLLERGKAFPRRAFLVGSTVLLASVLSGYGMLKNREGQIISHGDKRLQRMNVYAFDTVVSLVIEGDRSVLYQAASECARWHNLFSAWDASSEVSSINRARGNTVKVSADTLDLIAKTLPYCQTSKGKFDPTIGSVSLLWDFKNSIKPDSHILKEAVSHVDWRALDVQGDTVRLIDPAAALDFGGIAKGWIADRLADFFRSRGISSGLIDLGGNIYALGEKPDGEPWVIGIADPANPKTKVITTLKVRDCSVVTSGLYEKHFFDDGIDYHHILNSATGQPSQTNFCSSTIVSPCSLDGDALSTIMILDSDLSKIETVSKVSGVEILCVDRTGSQLMSEGLAAYF